MHASPPRLITAHGLILVMVSAAVAAGPRLGGPMKHVNVFIVAGQITILVDDTSEYPDGRLVLKSYGETYAPPADVLNDTSYNGQYGWLPNGLWPPLAGQAVWIEVLDQSSGLATYEQDSCAPIFGTSGSSPLWRWNGTMVHNWYAAGSCGDYDATYRVYIGDSTGVPSPAFAPGTVTLRWRLPPQAGFPDFDGDQDVDQEDFGHFQACITGQGQGPPSAGCADADLDADCDVDQDDFGLFQTCISGPSVPADPACRRP